MAALLACGTALAQEGNPYNGKWTATWLGAKSGTPNRADVVIQDRGGTFENQRSTRSNPCVGIKAPISVTVATKDELVFVIEFSKALGGCKDSEVRLKPVDVDTLKGLRAGKQEMTLKRK